MTSYLAAAMQCPHRAKHLPGSRQSSRFRCPLSAYVNLFTPMQAIPTLESYTRKHFPHSHCLSAWWTEGCQKLMRIYYRRPHFEHPCQLGVIPCDERESFFLPSRSLRICLLSPPSHSLPRPQPAGASHFATDCTTFPACCWTEKYVCRHKLRIYAAMPEKSQLHLAFCKITWFLMLSCFQNQLYAMHPLYRRTVADGLGFIRVPIP